MLLSEDSIRSWDYGVAWFLVSVALFFACVCLLQELFVEILARFIWIACFFFPKCINNIGLSLERVHKIQMVQTSLALGVVVLSSWWMLFLTAQNQSCVLLLPLLLMLLPLPATTDMPHIFLWFKSQNTSTHSIIFLVLVQLLRHTQPIPRILKCALLLVSLAPQNQLLCCCHHLYLIKRPHWSASTRIPMTTTHPWSKCSIGSCSIEFES